MDVKTNWASITLPTIITIVIIMMTIMCTAVVNQVIKTTGHYFCELLDSNNRNGHNNDHNDSVLKPTKPRVDSQKKASACSNLRSHRQATTPEGSHQGLSGPY